MVGEITKDTRSPLLPDRQEQGDFFVCDIFDAAPKGDMASMAHPIFSLSTKPDHRIRRYEDETGQNYLEVKPSADGLATIHDRDVLIYCISQIMAALNEGQKISQTIRLKAYDMLKATNRMTDGRGYEGLRAALVRLQGDGGLGETRLGAFGALAVPFLGLHGLGWAWYVLMIIVHR